MYRLAIISVLAAFLAGCQLNLDGSETTAANVDVSSDASRAIAEDMIARLTVLVSPGAASILVKPDPSSLGQAFIAALKAAGYTVVEDQQMDSKTTAIALTYRIDQFEGLVLARVSTGKLEIARAYRTAAAGTTPTSPVSIMQRL